MSWPKGMRWTAEHRARITRRPWSEERRAKQPRTWSAARRAKQPQRIPFVLHGWPSMARLREAWGGRCVACGVSRHLEFAHVKPTPLWGSGRSSYRRFRDIVTNPSCYVLLCRWCHNALDRGLELPAAGPVYRCGRSRRIA